MAPKKILLVDDDEPLRRMIRLTLEQRGFSVVEAKDGNDALAEHTKSPCDLILTDVLMPQRDGLELILALRQVAPSPKLIAMSGGGQLSAARYLRIARRLGAVRILEKPFTAPELIAAIDDAITAPLPDLITIG
jgi:two-component system, chemotaxis family, chemotaxis protein CheY